MYISSTIIKITIKADIFSFKVVFLISKLIFDFPIFISFLIFLCYNGCRWRVTIPQTCFLFGKLYYNAENKQVDCDCYFFYFQHFFIFLCHYNLFNSFLDISILYFNIKSQDFSFRACLLERKAFTIQNVSIKWYYISTKTISISYLQYKMFLLNSSQVLKANMKIVFTIHYACFCQL